MAITSGPISSVPISGVEDAPATGGQIVGGRLRAVVTSLTAQQLVAAVRCVEINVAVQPIPVSLCVSAAAQYLTVCGSMVQNLVANVATQCLQASFTTQKLTTAIVKNSPYIAAQPPPVGEPIGLLLAITRAEP